MCVTPHRPFVFNLCWEGKETQTERPVITGRGLLGSAQLPHLHNGFQLLVKNTELWETVRDQRPSEPP